MLSAVCALLGVLGIAGLNFYRMENLESATGLSRSDRLDASVVAETLTRYVSITHRGRAVPGEEWFGATSSRRLPSWLRLPVGWLEMLTRASNCDSQTRALVYLLSQHGIEAHQFDLFGISITHSLVRARIDDRWIVLDPYTGVLLKDRDGKLITFEEMKSTAPADINVVALRPDGPDFYDAIGVHLRQATGGQSGTEVFMPVLLRAAALPYALGEVDGNHRDIGIRMNETGIAARFIGAEFGSGKNARWTITTPNKNAQGRLDLMFVDDVPPDFPVVGANCGWPKAGGKSITCVFETDSSGSATIEMLYGDLRNVYRIDAITVSNS